MTRLYAIGYDFKNTNAQQYEAFFEHLKTLGPWWHFLEGTWLLVTHLSADEINNNLAQFHRNDVYLLVMEVGQDVSGWLPKKAQEPTNDGFNRLTKPTNRATVDLPRTGQTIYRLQVRRRDYISFTRIAS